MRRRVLIVAAESGGIVGVGVGARLTDPESPPALVLTSITRVTDQDSIFFAQREPTLLWSRTHSRSHRRSQTLHRPRKWRFLFRGTAGDHERNALALGVPQWVLEPRRQ